MREEEGEPSLSNLRRSRKRRAERSLARQTIRFKAGSWNQSEHQLLKGFGLCIAETFANRLSNCPRKHGCVGAVSAVDTIRIPDCQFQGMFHIPLTARRLMCRDPTPVAK